MTSLQAALPECDFSPLIETRSRSGSAPAVGAKRVGESGLGEVVARDRMEFQGVLDNALQRLTLGQQGQISRDFASRLASLSEAQLERYLGRKTAGLNKEEEETFRKRFWENATPEERLLALASQRVLEWGPQYGSTVFIRKPTDLLGTGHGSTVDRFLRSPLSIFSADPLASSPLFFSATVGGGLPTGATPLSEMKEIFGAEHEASIRSLWEAAQSHGVEQRLEATKAEVQLRLEEESISIEPPLQDNERLGAQFRQIQSHIQQVQTEVNALLLQPAAGDQAVLAQLSRHLALADSAARGMHQVIGAMELLPADQVEAVVESAQQPRTLAELLSAEPLLATANPQLGPESASSFRSDVLLAGNAVSESAMGTWKQIAALPVETRERVKRWTESELLRLEKERSAAAAKASQWQQRYGEWLRKDAPAEEVARDFPVMRADLRRVKQIESQIRILQKWRMGAHGWNEGLQNVVRQAQRDPDAFYDLSVLPVDLRRQLEEQRAQIDPVDLAGGESSGTQVQRAREKRRAYLARLDAALGIPGAAQALVDARKMGLDSQYRQAVMEFQKAGTKEEVEALLPRVLAMASRLFSHRGQAHLVEDGQITLREQVVDDGKSPAPVDGLAGLQRQGVTVVFDPTHVREDTGASYHPDTKAIKLPLQEPLGSGGVRQETQHETEHFHAITRGVGNPKDDHRHLLRMDFHRYNEETANLTPVVSTAYGGYQNLGEVEASFKELVVLMHAHRNPNLAWNSQRIRTAARDMEYRADATYHLTTEALANLRATGIQDLAVTRRDPTQPHSATNLTLVAHVRTHNGVAVIPIPGWPDPGRPDEAFEMARVLGQRSPVPAAVSRLAAPYNPVVEKLLTQAQAYALQRTRQAKAIQHWENQPARTEVEHQLKRQRIYRLVTGVGRLTRSGIRPSPEMEWVAPSPE